jgi:hypothetical protein
MAVYVDRLMPCIPTDRWPYRFSCHLVADGDVELDAFARRLGLRREWFQGHRGKLNHYDLTASKRKQALKVGAQEISGRDLVARFMRVRSDIDSSQGGKQE